MSRQRQRAAGPWVTSGAAGCSVFVFIVVLGVAAFLTRDASGPVSDAGSSTRPMADAGQVETPQTSIGDEVVLRSALLLEPALRACFIEALSKDPAAGRRAVLDLGVAWIRDRPALRSVVIISAPSPFFRPCLPRQAVPFLTSGTSEGLGRVHVRYEQGKVHFNVVGQE